MTFKSILLRLLDIKGAKVDGIDFEDGAAMTVHVHLVKRERWRCPVCGRRCGVYDHAPAESFWRSMDFGPVPVRIGAMLPRVLFGERGGPVSARSPSARTRRCAARCRARPCGRRMSPRGPLRGFCAPADRIP